MYLLHHKKQGNRLGRAPSTISRWLQKYRQGGLSELLKVKTAPGKAAQITSAALAGLQQRFAIA